MFMSWAYARMGVIALALFLSSVGLSLDLHWFPCYYVHIVAFATSLRFFTLYSILWSSLSTCWDRCSKGVVLRIFVKLEQPSIISSAKIAGQTAVMLSFIRKVYKSSTCTSWTHYYWIDRCQTRRIVARTHTTHCCSLRHVEIWRALSMLCHWFIDFARHLVVSLWVKVIIPICVEWALFFSRPLST